MPVTFGGFPARIVDVSFIGCRIEHTDRLPPKARMPLRFSWRGTQSRVEATVIRSELTSLGGKPAYISGLEFCDSIEASPAVIREIVNWLVAAEKKSQPQPAIPEPTSGVEPPSPPPPHAGEDAGTTPAPAAEEEFEVLSADYLRCTLTGGKWSKLYVDDPAQPADGFTIRAPSNESEADVLCRAYQKADAAKRKTMRASFEADIARNKR